jgi:3',5'-cyclic-AMP phosphodiesterase
MHGKVIPWVLALLLLLAGCASLPGPEPAFYFVQLTDTHFGDADHLERGRKAVERINQLPMPVEFVVITGDLTGERMRDPQLVGAVESLLGELHAPWLALPGNHDITRDHAEEEAALFRRHFGDFVQVREIGGVAAIFLYAEPAAREWPRLSGYDPLTALEGALAQVGEGPVLLFLHTPPVGGFFRNQLREGWPATESGRLEALLRRHDVRGVISGHFHKDELHWVGDTPLFVAPPLAGSWGRQGGIRLWEYRDGRLSYRTLYLE